VQEVHYCSGSVFVTGDAIATALLRFVQAIADARSSEVVSIPVLSRTGEHDTVTLMVNSVSQISMSTYGHVGADLEDSAIVDRLEARIHELSAAGVWLGEDAPSAA
jgi:hypothetical protein